MKDYLNLFYGMIDKINDWEKQSMVSKEAILSSFLDKSADVAYLASYFDKYRLDLLNNTFNSYIKGVIKT